MARNRMIKPEFWDDEKLSAISRDARLTFIGLWTHSDDEGVVKGNLRWLRNSIFPYDNIKLETFQKWVEEILSLKVIMPFEANEEKYFHIKNFNKHQTINKPSKTKNPQPTTTVLHDYYRSSKPVVTPEVKRSISKEKESISEKKRDLPEKSPAFNLQYEMRLIFEDFYRSKTKQKYYYDGKCAGSLKQITNKIKAVSGKEDLTDQEILSGFKYILLNLNDEWVLNNLSIPIINSKFNEILNKTQNGKFNNTANRNTINARESISELNLGIFSKG